MFFWFTSTCSITIPLNSHCPFRPFFLPFPLLHTQKWTFLLVYPSPFGNRLTLLLHAHCSLLIAHWVFYGSIFNPYKQQNNIISLLTLASLMILESLSAIVTSDTSYFLLSKSMASFVEVMLWKRLFMAFTPYMCTFMRTRWCTKSLLITWIITAEEVHWMTSIQGVQQQEEEEGQRTGCSLFSHISLVKELSSLESKFWNENDFLFYLFSWN